MAKKCLFYLFFSLQTSSLVQYQSPAYVSGFHMLSEGGIDATSECNRGVERVRYTHFSWCDLKNSILTSHQCLPSDFRLIKKHRRENCRAHVWTLSSWREPGEYHGRQYRNPVWGRADDLLPEISWKSWDHFQFLPCLPSIHWKAGYEEKQVTNTISASSADFYMSEQGRK